MIQHKKPLWILSALIWFPSNIHLPAVLSNLLLLLLINFNNYWRYLEPAQTTTMVLLCTASCQISVGSADMALISYKARHATSDLHHCRSLYSWHRHHSSIPARNGELCSQGFLPSTSNSPCWYFHSWTFCSPGIKKNFSLLQFFLEMWMHGLFYLIANLDPSMVYFMIRLFYCNFTAFGQYVRI